MSEQEHEKKPGFVSSALSKLGDKVRFLFNFLFIYFVSFGLHRIPVSCVSLFGTSFKCLGLTMFSFSLYEIL